MSLLPRLLCVHPLSSHPLTYNTPAQLKKGLVLLKSQNTNMCMGLAELSNKINVVGGSERGLVFSVICP